MEIAKIKNQIEINNNKIYTEYYHYFNDRPTLVFLHDSLGCTVLWRDFPKKLATATQTNLLVYDRLGYGKSEPIPTHIRPTYYMEQESDTLHDLLTKLQIHDAILFGHSDGGTIALLTASKYPNKIKGIICEAGHIFVEDLTLKGIHEAVEAYQKTNLPERLFKYHGDKTDTIFKAWTKTWTTNDFRDWNIEHFLKHIICPLLFIQGEADEYGTLAQVEKTINQVSGKTETLIIQNVGHTPHKEVPDLVLESCRIFIDSCSS